MTNTGDYPEHEVVQLYLTDEEASVAAPLLSVQSITLAPGENKKVVFTITSAMLELINEQGESILEQGDFTITIAGSLPTNRATELGAAQPVSTRLTLR